MASHQSLHWILLHTFPNCISIWMLRSIFFHYMDFATCKLKQFNLLLEAKQRSKHVICTTSSGAVVRQSVFRPLPSHISDCVWQHFGLFQHIISMVFWWFSSIQSFNASYLYWFNVVHQTLW